MSGIGSGLNSLNKRNIQTILVKSINNTSTKTKQWKTSDNIVIESIHPPKAKIDKNVNGTIISASLFKTKKKNMGIASAVDVKKIIEQNNTLTCFLRLQKINLIELRKSLKPKIILRQLLLRKIISLYLSHLKSLKNFQENPFVDQDLIKRISEKVKRKLNCPKYTTTIFSQEN